MVSKATAFVAALCLAVPALASDDQPEKQKKLKRPGLELRATPRYSFSPARIMFTAELKGGDDVEALYCPEIEWDWDDEGKSVQESDCDPWTEGTKIERRFSNDHDYRKAGTYNVKATFRRSGRTLAQATVRVTVRAGLGDNTIED